MNDQDTRRRSYRRFSVDAPSLPVVLVGMMGVGKSSIGRRLASRIGLPFIDSDAEIEAAAGRSIVEIFEEFGEAAFRDGERRVLARLIDGRPAVIATGGGAFIDDETRALIKARALSVWLDADLAILLERTARRDTRPLLLEGDPGETLRRLKSEREAIYRQADIHVRSGDGPHDAVVAQILEALEGRVVEIEETSP
ncbi:MAG: shikimate kinase [Rhodothalassiaceae bacterium]